MGRRTHMTEIDRDDCYIKLLHICWLKLHKLLRRSVLTTHSDVPMGKNKKKELQAKRHLAQEKEEEEKFNNDNKEDDGQSKSPKPLTAAERQTKMHARIDAMIAQRQKEDNQKVEQTRSDKRFHDDTQKAIKASLQTACANTELSPEDAHSVWISERQAQREAQQAKREERRMRKPDEDGAHGPRLRDS